CRHARIRASGRSGGPVRISSPRTPRTRSRRHRRRHRRRTGTGWPRPPRRRRRPAPRPRGTGDTGRPPRQPRSSPQTTREQPARGGGGWGGAVGSRAASPGGGRGPPRRWRSLRAATFAGAPVPAGISLPMITFSFRPIRWSLAPLMAASVSTRVVSWKEAAARNDEGLSDAFVTPSRTVWAVAGTAPAAGHLLFAARTSRRHVST